MDIPQLHLDGVKFPGKAGEYQRSGMTVALIRELGDNYAPYHTYLFNQLKKTGGRPDPARFRGDFPGYQGACGAIDRLLIAEAVLRRCRLIRQGVTSTAPSVIGDPPLVDDRHRLISVEDPGQAARQDPVGNLDARPSVKVPPPFPLQ
jgi:hypothetical protein